MNFDTLISLISQEIIVHSVLTGTICYGPLGAFELERPSDDPMNDLRFAQAFMDVRAKYNHYPDSKDECRFIFQQYLNDRSTENWVRLNEAFEKIPFSFERNALFGMDNQGLINIKHAIHGKPLDHQDARFEIVSWAVENDISLLDRLPL